MEKKKELTNEEIDGNIFDMCSTCSTADCTGLIPAKPVSDAEIESYEDLYPFRPPVLNIKDCPNLEEEEPEK